MFEISEPYWGHLQPVPLYLYPAMAGAFQFPGNRLFFQILLTNGYESLSFFGLSDPENDKHFVFEYASLAVKGM